MLASWGLGFLIGIGAFIGPVRWALGKDLHEDDKEYMAGKDQGKFRYLKFCTDHKVVGVQYLVLGMTTLGIGGVMAMIIRTQLARPGARIVNPQTYNALVGLHGIIMIVSLSIIVAGPFGNFILPIMIGARDMAFPRLNALSSLDLVRCRHHPAGHGSSSAGSPRDGTPTRRCPFRPRPAWTPTWSPSSCSPSRAAWAP